MKIVENKEGGQVLLNDNGIPKNCPFQPSQLVPGSVQGSIQEIHKPCGNWCPFFSFEIYKDNHLAPVKKNGMKNIRLKNSLQLECKKVIVTDLEVIKPSNLQKL